MEDDNSINQKVIKYLNDNPNQKRYNVKTICNDLGIDPIYITEKRQYIYNIIQEYKSNLSNRQGLKSLNFHNWRGFLFADKCLDRELALKSGWYQAKAKNHMILFKNDLGRLQWHLNGRINVWVKKPVSEGKMMQLMADAFFKNDLILSIDLFQKWAHTLKMKGVHCAIDTGQALPYMKFEGFKESNGTVLLLGDRSHPTSAELVINYPDWAERNENMVASTTQMLTTLMASFTQQNANFVESQQKMMQQQKEVSEMLASMNGSTKAKPVEMRIYE